MYEQELLAEFTDGTNKKVERITEELVLGDSWRWLDEWWRIAKVEPIRQPRTDGVRFRVTVVRTFADA